MSKSFQHRLQVVMREGNLTLSDLSRWFDRPYPTVRQWATGNAEPGRSPADISEAQYRLAILEKSRKLPVPRLGPRARIDYMADVRKAAGF